MSTMFGARSLEDPINEKELNKDIKKSEIRKRIKRTIKVINAHYPRALSKIISPTKCS